MTRAQYDAFVVSVQGLYGAGVLELDHYEDPAGLANYDTVTRYVFHDGTHALARDRVFPPVLRRVDGTAVSMVPLAGLTKSTVPETNGIPTLKTGPNTVLLLGHPTFANVNGLLILDEAWQVG